MDTRRDAASGPGAAPRFQALRAAAFERFENHDYRGVLPFALEAEALYPAKGEVPFWLACAHCRIGDPEAALAALRAGLARGHYWPADWLLEDDDLEPLRGRPELAAIVRESAAAPDTQVSTPAPSSRSCSCLRPGRAAALRRPPLCWPCTAGARTPTSTPSTGRRPRDRGFTVVVPRSESAALRRASSCGTTAVRRAQTWRRSTVRACAATPVGSGSRGAPAADPARPLLLLAGFSQGGGLAVDLAIDAEPAQCAGFLAIATGVEDLAEPPTPDRLARGRRPRPATGGCLSVTTTRPSTERAPWLRPRPAPA